MNSAETSTVHNQLACRQIGGKFLLVTGVALLAAEGSAIGQWVFPTAPSIQRIGLYGTSEFRSSSGSEQSTFQQIHSTGIAVGHSVRYLGGSIEHGEAAWRWDKVRGTVRLGFFEGAEFTRSDGYQLTSLRDSSPQGWNTGVSAMFGSTGSSAGWAAWVSRPDSVVERIGLYSTPEYTRNDGYRQSELAWCNNSGRLSGWSARYGTAGTNLGQSTWAWDSATGTVRTGLVSDGEFTRSDGYRFGTTTHITRAGLVLGTSSRFVGQVDAGAATWAWEPSLGTARMGLFEGAEYTRSDGYQRSRALRVSETGLVLGISDRFNGTNQERGEATWVWDRTRGSVRIGLFGIPGYTSADGYALTSAGLMTSTERVAGSSEFFVADTSQTGRSAWVWDAALGTVQIGLHGDPEFMQGNGLQQCAPEYMNDAGRVVGNSDRYNGGHAYLGNAVWTWDDACGTQRIGLHGTAEFITEDGRQESRAQRMDSVGRIWGYSERYNQDTGNGPDSGIATWVWTERNGTVRIGLYGTPEFTSIADIEKSDVDTLSYGGRLQGYSVRSPMLGSSLGFASWLWDETHGTFRTGLIDGMHTSDTGYQSSLSVSEYSLAETPDAQIWTIGYSNRYGGGRSLLGQSLWAVAPNSTETIPLVFSIASDGRANTVYSTQTLNGWILGNYDLYDGNALLSTNAFIWSQERGFADLGAIVDGGLSANGWSALFDTYGADGVRTVFGYGRIFGGNTASQGVFAMTIPEPTPAVLFGFASLFFRRTRSDCSAMG